MDTLYEEHQTQRRLLPWLIVAFVWVVSLMQMIHNGITKENVVFDILVLILLPLVITILLFKIKLSVIVDSNSLSFRLFPIYRDFTKIYLSDIKKVTIKRFNNRLFRGWGVGITWNDNYKSYTIHGNQGVEIQLKDGMKIFIGSQYPDFLMDSLLKRIR